MELYRYDQSAMSDKGYELRTFEVIKETPQGYWILEKRIYSFQIDMDDEEKKKWVSKHGRKRFAFPTHKEALEHFQFRKRAQIRHLESQLHWAKMALKKANEESEIELIPYSDMDKLMNKPPILLKGTWRFGGFLTKDDMNL